MISFQSGGYEQEGVGLTNVGLGDNVGGRDVSEGVRDGSPGAGVLMITVGVFVDWVVGVLLGSES